MEWIVETEYIETPGGTYKDKMVSCPKVGAEGRWFHASNDRDRHLLSCETRETALAAIERAWARR